MPFSDRCKSLSSILPSWLFDRGSVISISLNLNLELKYLCKLMVDEISRTKSMENRMVPLKDFW